MDPEAHHMLLSDMYSGNIQLSVPAKSPKAAQPFPPPSPTSNNIAAPISTPNTSSSCPHYAAPIRHIKPARSSDPFTADPNHHDDIDGMQIKTTRADYWHVARTEKEQQFLAGTSSEKRHRVTGVPSPLSSPTNAIPASPTTTRRRASMTFAPKSPSHATPFLSYPASPNATTLQAATSPSHATPMSPSHATSPSPQPHLIPTPPLSPMTNPPSYETSITIPTKSTITINPDLPINPKYPSANGKVFVINSPTPSPSHRPSRPSSSPGHRSHDPFFTLADTIVSSLLPRVHAQRRSTRPVLHSHAMRPRSATGKTSITIPWHADVMHGKKDDTPPVAGQFASRLLDFHVTATQAQLVQRAFQALPCEIVIRAIESIPKFGVCIYDFAGHRSAAYEFIATISCDAAQTIRDQMTVTPCMVIWYVFRAQADEIAKRLADLGVVADVVYMDDGDDTTIPTEQTTIDQNLFSAGRGYYSIHLTNVLRYDVAIVHAVRDLLQAKKLPSFIFERTAEEVAEEEARIERERQLLEERRAAAARAKEAQSHVLPLTKAGQRIFAKKEIALLKAEMKRVHHQKKLVAAKMENDTMVLTEARKEFTGKVKEHEQEMIIKQKQLEEEKRAAFAQLRIEQAELSQEKQNVEQEKNTIIEIKAQTEVATSIAQQEQEKARAERDRTAAEIRKMEETREQMEQTRIRMEQQETKVKQEQEILATERKRVDNKLEEIEKETQRMESLIKQQETEKKEVEAKIAELDEKTEKLREETLKSQQESAKVMEERLKLQEESHLRKVELERITTERTKVESDLKEMKELKKKIKEDKKALEKATKEADKAKMQCEEERRLFEERQFEEMIKGKKGKDREKLEKEFKDRQRAETLQRKEREKAWKEEREAEEKAKKEREKAEREAEAERLRIEDETRRAKRIADREAGILPTTAEIEAERKLMLNEIAEEKEKIAKEKSKMEAEREKLEKQWADLKEEQEKLNREKEEKEEELKEIEEDLKKRAEEAANYEKEQAKKNAMALNSMRYVAKKQVESAVKKGMKTGMFGDLDVEELTNSVGKGSNSLSTFEQVDQLASKKLTLSLEELDSLSPAEKAAREEEIKKYDQYDECYRKYLGLTAKVMQKLGKVPYQMLVEMSIRDVDNLNVGMQATALVQIYASRQNIQELISETEISQGCTYRFTKQILSVEKLCHMQLERDVLFKVMNYRNAEKTLIGECALSLAKVQETVGDAMPLIHPEKKKKSKTYKDSGSLIIHRAQLCIESTHGAKHYPCINMKDPSAPTYARQTECHLQVVMAGENLQKKGLFGGKKPDPYVEFYRWDADNKWSMLPAAKTEVQHGDSVKWRICRINLHDIAYGDCNRMILAKCFSGTSLGKPDFIGQAEFAIIDVINDSGKEIYLVNPDAKNEKKEDKPPKLVFTTARIYSLLSDLDALCENAGMRPGSASAKKKRGEKLPPLGIRAVMMDEKQRQRRRKASLAATPEMMEKMAEIAREAKQNDANSDDEEEKKEEKSEKTKESRPSSGSKKTETRPSSGSTTKERRPSSGSTKSNISSKVKAKS